jgi:ribosomal-protein-alanine N-acetyltransferase
VPEDGTVDVGAGIRPDLLGQRIGTALMPLVVTHARSRFAPQRLRGAIAEFNTRSRRVCLAAGFRPVRTFEGPQGRRFVELVLEVPGSQAEQGRGPKGRRGSSSAPSQARTR